MDCSHFVTTELYVGFITHNSKLLSTFKLIYFHRHFKVRLLVKRVSFFDTIIDLFLQIYSTVDMGIEVPNACSPDMPRIFQLGSLNHVVRISLVVQVEIFGVRPGDFDVN